MSKLMSLQDPSYLKELHEVSSLLFSLLPTFNIKQSATTFDFYFDIRNVGFCLEELMISVGATSETPVMNPNGGKGSKCKWMS